MAKRASGRKAVFQLEIANDERDGLQRVAQDKLTTMSDIMRRLIQAVALVKYKRGQKLAIVNSDDQIVAYVTGL
jgi:hypothetical protein